MLRLPTSLRTPLARLLAVATACLLLTEAPGARTEPDVDSPDIDPRNWPTATRLVMDRHDIGGRIFALRVHARRSDYFNCNYRGTEDRFIAFTLLAGPGETLTGYIPRETARVLERVLNQEPWAPVTVHVTFDPARLSDLCPDQVEVVKWSRGWQYPPESLSPARPDPALHPTPAQLETIARAPIWKELVNPETALVGKTLEVGGGVRLSTTYHCAFRNAWRTHWGLQLFDGRGRTLHAYLPKSEQNRALVDHIALHRETAVVFNARVVQLAMSTYCGPQLEVLGWTLADGVRAPAGP